MTNHLFDGLLARAEPARRFATICDGPFRYYNYSNVLDVSARLAKAITAMGVAPGDRVAVQVPKSLEALMLYLGVVRAGAVFLPLNTAYTAREVDYFVGDATPAVLVGDPARAGELAPVAARHGARFETMGVWRGPDEDAGSLLAATPPDGTPFDTVPRGPDDLAAILYTSGTTGRSKGAMLSHDNLLSNAKTLARLWRFGSDDVLIHALPIFHTHGLFVATNVALVAGASLAFFEKFDPDAVVHTMPDATTLMGVPTFYTRLLATPGLGEAARTMRLFVSGSAPLLAETHRSFEEITGHAILERYGMTETNMSTSNPYDGERRAGTVGMPLPDVDLRITEPGTEPPVTVPQGETGMIEVRGPNVFQGYWNMPEKTAEEKRSDGWFITGDLGRMDEDGYVHIVGRAKDLIISGGFNVYPKEVETVIDALPGIAESAVIGVPHPDFGEGVVAIVVPAGDACEAATIADALKSELARYKQPKHIAFRDALPRNSMGKVQKNVLREEYAKLFTA